MKITELSAGLGISRQMTYRLKARGMPIDSLESAVAWRDRNLDVTQTKVWRIDGNKGVSCKPEKVNNNTPADRVYTAAEIKTIEETLTKIVPELWFSQIGWLGTALREQGVKIKPKQLIEAQSVLFMIYMSEITDYLEQDEDKTLFEIPPALMARPSDKIYPSLIASLDQILNK